MIDLAYDCKPCAYIKQYSNRYNDTQNDKFGNTFLSEFDEQKKLWLAWEWGCAKKDMPYHSVIIDIVKAVSPENQVGILYNEEDDLTKIKACLEAEVELSEKISFFPIPTSSSWIRDTGPTFIKNKNNQTAVVQFDFKSWGYLANGETCSDTEADYYVTSNFAKTFNLPLFKSSISSEGGNRETNGKGVLIVGEDVELSRNPGMTKKELEDQYALFLGIKKTIWLPSGLNEDDSTTNTLLFDSEKNLSLFTPFTPGGHIDEFCRFADDRTILLAEAPVDEAATYPHIQENIKRLEKCYEILSKATDQNGNPFTIIRVPSARTMTETFYPEDPFFDYYARHTFKPNQTFPKGRFPKQSQYDIVVSASYLNFLKINNTIVISAYWKEGLSEKIKATDDEVYACFKKLYPKSKIVQIRPYNINISGGGIHCISLNEPL